MLSTSEAPPSAVAPISIQIIHTHRGMNYREMLILVLKNWRFSDVRIRAQKLKKSLLIICYNCTLFFYLQFYVYNYFNYKVNK